MAQDGAVLVRVGEVGVEVLCGSCFGVEGEEPEHHLQAMQAAAIWPWTGRSGCESPGGDGLGTHFATACMAFQSLTGAFGVGVDVGGGDLRRDGPQRGLRCGQGGLGGLDALVDARELGVFLL